MKIKLLGKTAKKLGREDRRLIAKMIRKSLHTIYSDDLERQFTISVRHENTYIVKTYSKKLGWQFCRMEIVEPNKLKTITLDENKILKRITEIDAEIETYKKQQRICSDFVDKQGYSDAIEYLKGEKWFAQNLKQFEV